MRKALLAALIVAVLGALALIFWPREVERDPEVSAGGTASMLVSEEPRPREAGRQVEGGEAGQAASNADLPSGLAEPAHRDETAVAALPDAADGPALDGRAPPAVDGGDENAAEPTVPNARVDHEADGLAALSPPAGEDEARGAASASEPDSRVEDAEAPILDLVRVSPDGQTVIAGRARPGENVEVLLDGEVLASAEADASGTFATVTDTPSSGEPREVVLRVRREAAEGVAAAEGGVTSPAPAGEGPADPGYAFSAPVVILPSADPAEAPVLVSRGEESLDVVQPAVPQAADRMALDRITYEPGGDVIASGRGPEASAVRAYSNGELVAQAQVGEDGSWQAVIPSQVAQQMQLLRFDEVSASGEVLSRLETPFDYVSEGADQELRNQEVTIQRGNNLWRMAEEHYGEGLRYSVIYSANAELIRDPDLIYPGQVFTVPELVESE